MPVVIGMYGKALFPDAPTASILFTVVLQDMPPIVAGLMIAAVLSAVMSTMDIGLLNVTANAVNDIYFKTLNPKADEKKLGRLSAIVTLVSGVIALILAISSSSILSLLSSTYSIMNAGALVMVLGGIFWKKGNRQRSMRHGHDHSQQVRRADPVHCLYLSHPGADSLHRRKPCDAA